VLFEFLRRVTRAQATAEPQNRLSIVS
jgi:hypothetical protein